MPCDKCYDKFRDGEDLNEVVFGESGSYEFCDNCTEKAYDYLSDML